MHHGMTVWANRHEVANRIQVVFLLYISKWNDMLNMDVVLSPHVSG